MAGRSAERRERVTRGTGNVFADLGFPNAAERQAKLRLASVLNQVLEGRKLSQGDAAKVLGVTQPKVSALRHYKLAGFSVERLMNLLTALDQDVEIVIWRKPRSRKVARISVVAAYDLQTALKPGSHSSRIRNPYQKPCAAPASFCPTPRSRGQSPRRVTAESVARARHIGRVVSSGRSAGGIKR